VAVKAPPKHKSTQTTTEVRPPITAVEVKEFVKNSTGEDVIRVLAMIHSAVGMGKLSQGRELNGFIKLGARVMGSARSHLSKKASSTNAQVAGPSREKRGDEHRRKHKDSRGGHTHPHGQETKKNHHSDRGHKRRHSGDEKKGGKRTRRE
jgi:hypothetical protein